MAEITVDVTGHRLDRGRAHLRLVRGLPPAQSERPVTVRCMAADALSNFIAVLELTADGQVRCGASSRRPLAATVRLVDDVLVGGDYYDRGGEPIAAFAWPMLLLSSGLARLAGTTLELTSRGEAALARPSYQALGELWERWLRSVSHDELSRIEAIRGQHKAATLTPVARRRAAVADGLAAVRPGEWVDVDTMFGILATQPGPLMAARSQLALWRLYVVDPCHGSLGHAGGRAWEVVEGRYALCVLFEYAGTMGVVDVAYTDPRGARQDYRGLWGVGGYDCLSRYDGLSAVRINRLGAAILRHPDALPALGLPVPMRDPR